MGILERNQEKLGKVITHSFVLEDWGRAFEARESRKAIKAVLVNPS